MSPIAMLLAFVVQNVDSPDLIAVCASDRKARFEDVKEVDEAYGRRSIAIVKAALAHDANALQRMVAPTATFVIFQGDEGLSPRITGAAAAEAFFAQIAPKAFESSTDAVSLLATDPCGDVSVALTLVPNASNFEGELSFHYRRGALTAVTGRYVERARGEFATPNGR